MILRPNEHGAKCEQCPLYKAKTFRPVPGSGPVNAIGIILGEAPSAEDVVASKPFCGHTGRYLDDELNSAGLSRGRLYQLNAVACARPKGTEEKAMKVAVDCCAGLLKQQLYPFDAKTPILAMGKWAYYAMTGKTTGVGGARGFIRDEVSLEKD